MDRYTGPTREPEVADPGAGAARPRAPRPVHRATRSSAWSRSTSSPTPGTTSATTARCPKAGDYLTVEIGGRPLIVVRHSDDSVRVLMNRCAHKGSRLVTAPCGNTGKFFRCPYHAWTFRTDGSLLNIPVKNGYDGTARARVRKRQGPGRRAERARLPRLHLRQDQRRRPRLRGVLRRLAQLASTTWPTARPKASSRSPAAACASCTTATGRCSSRTSTTPCTRWWCTSRRPAPPMKMWMGKPADAAQADGHRAVRALHVGLQVLRRHGRARVRQRAQLLRRQLQHPLQVLGVPAYEEAMDKPPTASSARTTSWA